MKGLTAFALAAVLTLALGASAAAADLNLYAEYGFGLEQVFLGDFINTASPVVPDGTLVYGLGGTVKAGAFLAGGDFYGLNLSAAGSVTGGMTGNYDAALGLRFINAYGGLRLINAKAFKLYALAGYAGFGMDLAGTFSGYDVTDQYDEDLALQLGATTRGPVAGAGAELVLGRFTLSGKALTTIGMENGALWAILSGSNNGESGTYSYAVEGPVGLTLADLRCTYNFNDTFAVFTGLHYADVNIDIVPDDVTGSFSRAAWFTAGVSVSF